MEATTVFPIELVASEQDSLGNQPFSFGYINAGVIIAVYSQYITHVHLLVKTHILHKSYTHYIYTVAESSIKAGVTVFI